LLAIVLALGTSVAYGTSNLLGPVLNRRYPLAAILLFGQSAALIAAAVLLVVSGEPAPHLGAIGMGVLAGAGNLLGLAAFLRASQLGSVSIVSSIGAMGTGLPVLIGLAGGDELTGLQIAGILVAVGGAILAAQSSEHADIEPAGVAWALVSAVGFGTLLAALPEAAADSQAWALLDARAAVVVFLVAGIAVLRAPFAAPVRAVPMLAAPGLLLFAGTIMYTEATARGQLSVSAVLASLATVVTATLAVVVFREKLSAVQWSGVVLATTGVVLLAL
jgi:drug/metabolite transporter (DMT)-like permease